MSEVAHEVVDAAVGSEIAAPNPLERIRAGLEALVAEAKSVDLSPAALATSAGDRAARTLRMRCVKLRTGADEAYETVNRPLLTKQREARTLLADIKAAISTVEDPADKAIRESEAAAEAKRQARIEAERQRRAALQGRIDQMAGVARRALGKPSAEIEAKIKLIVGITIGDDFGDMKAEAERVHADTLASLRELLEATEAQEAEAARVAAERERMERARVMHERLALLRFDGFAVGMSAEQMREAIQARAVAVRSAEEWGEFVNQAHEADVAALTSMRAAVERQEQAEADEAQRRRRADFDADVREMRAGLRHPDVVGAHVSTLRNYLVEFDALKPTSEKWPEFADEAKAADAEVRAALVDMIDQQEAREQERQQRAEQDRVDAEARAQREQADREIAERQAAEQQRLDEQRAELERQRVEALAADLRRQRQDAFVAAAERVGRDRAVAVHDRFAADGEILSCETDAYIDAMGALQPEQASTGTGEPTVEAPGDTVTGDGAGGALPLIDDGCRLRLGELCTRLGFTVDRDFIEVTCGVPAAGTERRAVLFRACDWPQICNAIVDHVQRVRDADWRSL